MPNQRLLRFLSHKLTPAVLLGGSAAHLHQTKRTSLDYWEHDPKDFDYYVSCPTVDDLPVLLHKFDVENQEVWPWVWTHPNDNGPHHVFVGVNEHVLKQIKQLRAASPQNNQRLYSSEGLGAESIQA